MHLPPLDCVLLANIATGLLLPLKKEKKIYINIIRNPVNVFRKESGNVFSIDISQKGTTNPNTAIK